MKIQYLRWDTENFGFKVGLVEVCSEDNFSLELVEQLAKNEKYKLVYIKSTYLLNCPSIFCDEKLVYKQLNNAIETLQFPNIESYTLKTVEAELYELSLRSGKYSRYNLDNKFPNECFQRLYYKWIYNSIYTDYATDVLVYRINGKVVGLLSYKNDKENSNIGIIAVNPNYQRYGIGSKLLKHYQSLLGNNIKTMTVVTQGINQIARFFYEKNGYNISSRTYIYHLWI